MPIQAPQWTEFLSCPVCYNVFNEELYRPISLACGHTVCKTCLSKFQQRKCPFDQSLITRDIEELPANFALLQLISVTASPDKRKSCVPEEYKKHYEKSRKCVEDLALLLKPVSSSMTFKHFLNFLYIVCNNKKKRSFELSLSPVLFDEISQ